MLCAGASEQAVSQWASTFAENALGIGKTAGDLAGPMAFALLMGISRAIFGKYGDRLNLDKFMLFSTLLCIASYLCIALVPVPAISLIGCALCGLSVGILWPGTFSKASSGLPAGGTAMFALLALAGDLGCTAGSGITCAPERWRPSCSRFCCSRAFCSTGACGLPAKERRTRRKRDQK